MTYALLLLGGLMAVIVWWLVRQTVNVKPWMAQRPIEIVHGDGAL